MEAKSGGRVLEPVSLLIRNVFQLEKRCRRAENTHTHTHIYKFTAYSLFVPVNLITQDCETDLRSENESADRK